MIKKDVWQHNEKFWDQEAVLENPWSKPVSKKIINEAKNGIWSIHITKNTLPEDWLPQNIKGKDILCLASAGGQQAPVLAATGANVTVFDISENQLEKDRFVAKRDGLELKTIQGTMTDLSAFPDNSFDYIIHPISNIYVPDVNPVWCECFRVLRVNGRLLSSSYNPIVFVFDRDKSLIQQGLLKPKYKIPYSDLQSLSPEEYQDKISAGQAICFGHSLSDLIGGQCKAGFVIEAFNEDEHPSPRFLIEKYLPIMIATKAIKIAR